MKKVISLFACIAVGYCSFAQESHEEQANRPLTKQDYLQKSKRQKTGAIVLISAGGALVIGGTIVATNNLNYNIDIFNTTQPVRDDNDETVATVMVITGLAAMAASIGLFVSAHKNKKRALSLSFNNEPALQLKRSMVFYRSVPSLSLKLKF